jgi:hypothetical protein
MYVYDNISLPSFKITDFSEKYCRENQNADFKVNSLMVEPDRPQMAVHVFGQVI